MAFCGNCGTKIDEGVKFCPGCGQVIQVPPADEQPKDEPAAEQPAEQTETKQDLSSKMANLNNTADTTDQFDPDDIEKNKAMGLLAYILFFIPLLAAKDSPFAKYHTNQGFVLFLSYIVASVLWIIPILGWIAAPIVYIAVTVLSIMGIINALGGKAINLPIVGKLKIFK